VGVGVQLQKKNAKIGRDRQFPGRGIPLFRPGRPRRERPAKAGVNIAGIAGVDERVDQNGNAEVILLF
jgi:hypothetical protein